MSDSNYKVISEDIFRKCNTVGIQINLAKPESLDLLQLIKEREELKKNLELKEKEINSLLAKQYDLTIKMEKLQKNNKSSASPAQKSSGQITPNPTKGKRVSVDTGKKTTSKHEEPKDVPPKSLHPKIPNMENLQSDTLGFYQEIAKCLPDLKLSTILDAEAKFQKADSNRDGVIDFLELDEFLSSYNLLLTKRQLEEILQEIDTDNTKTVDFVEALKIVDRLWTNRPTKLPDDIRKNRSKMCILQ